MKHIVLDISLTNADIGEKSNPNLFPLFIYAIFDFFAFSLLVRFAFKTLNLIKYILTACVGDVKGLNKNYAFCSLLLYVLKLKFSQSFTEPPFEGSVLGNLP